jgi:hypothetical protein
VEFVAIGKDREGEKMPMRIQQNTTEKQERNNGVRKKRATIFKLQRHVFYFPSWYNRGMSLYLAE